MPQLRPGDAPLPVMLPVPVPTSNSVRVWFDEAGAAGGVTVTAMLAVTTEPVVSTPIAVTVETAVVPLGGEIREVTRPVWVTDTLVKPLELQVTLLVRFWTTPLPVRFPIAISCVTAPAPVNVTALGMMVTAGTLGVVELTDTVTVAVAEMPA